MKLLEKNRMMSGSEVSTGVSDCRVEWKNILRVNWPEEDNWSFVTDVTAKRIFEKNNFLKIGLGHDACRRLYI